MSDIQEVKDIFADVQKVTHALRTEVEDLKGKSKDFVDADRVAKIEATLAAELKAANDANAELKSRLADLETKTNRPGAPGGKDVSPERKAFADYMRKGVEAAELKAMQVGIGADGGFAVPREMAAGIQERLWRSSPVRQVASIVTVDGSAYDMLLERGQAGFEWAGETSTRNETDTPTINRITITKHELSAMPKVSQRMLDQASFDVEGWLTGRVADRFGRAEASAFVSGAGINTPKGFLAYSTAATADDTRAAETLQHRNTGQSGAFATTGPADVLLQTFYDLQAQYQANAVWMMKNTTLAAVAVLKDGNGQYLLSNMLNTDGTMLQTIMGRPAVQADDMPAIASNSLSIAVGDFARGYTIVQGPGIRVLRDPFSAKPHVLFYTTANIGGGVTDFDAIKLIRFGS